MLNRDDDGEEKDERGRGEEERRERERHRQSQCSSRQRTIALLAYLTIGTKRRKTIGIRTFTVFLGSDERWVNPK